MSDSPVNWKRIYIAVVIYTAALIVLLWWFSAAFTP
jgi:hypothetical protein